MTKEEIIDRALNSLEGWKSEKDTIEDAMDQYARQQAIAFAIEYATGKLVFGFGEMRTMEDVANDRMDDRYDIFLKDQKQNNQ